jgi:hypothetical protein
MNNQKTIFAIIAVVAALSVAAIAPAMVSTAMAAPGDNDPFTKTGNPHDQPGAGDGNPNCSSALLSHFIIIVPRLPRLVRNY